MSIKTLKARFQISNCDGSLGQALVTIMANGNEVFSGYLAETLDSFPVQILSTLTPYSEAVFDLDIADWAPGTTDNSINVPMEFTCAGGDISLQGIYSNYCISSEIDPTDPTKRIIIPGNANTFVLYNIDTQPLVNGNVISGRYNIDDNFGKTGPGCIFIYRGEIVSLGAYIQKFNDTVPVGNSTPV
jgi:hypothetical protein